MLTLVLTGLNYAVSENSSEACFSDVVLYTYASTGCPHCAKLRSFFDSTDFRDKCIFCYGERHLECIYNYYNFTQEALKLQSSGDVNSVIDPYRLPVPFTIVIKNKTYILGIVVGEVLDRGFWVNLACREPGGEIPLYAGTSQVGSLKANFTEQLSLAQLVLSFMPPDYSTNQPWLPGELIVGIVAVGVPVAVIGVYYLYTHLFLKESAKRKMPVKGASRKRR
jgi:hypothetical protein